MQFIFVASSFLLITTSCDKEVTGPNNKPPEPSITFSEPVRPGVSAQFDGSASIDPDGTIDSCVWDFGDATKAYSLLTKKTFKEAGTFPVSLSVRDNSGVWSQTNKSAVVKANTKPKAAFTHTKDAYYDDPVIFDASPSIDDDGTVASAEWHFSDNTTSKAMKVTKRFKMIGALTVKLVVTDNEGAIGSVSKTLTIQRSGDANECAVWDGNYKSTRHWSNASGGNVLAMDFRTSLKAIDPAWQAVGNNSATAAMSEWNRHSGAEIQFVYFSSVSTGTGGSKVDAKNSIWAAAIDGSGGILAQTYAWYNTSNNRIVETDVIVDRVESWSVTGLSLVQVLTHELGHAWGLDDLYSTTDRWETMYGYYSGAAGSLYCGDKRGVQALYGVKKAIEFNELEHTLEPAEGSSAELLIPEPPSVLVIGD
jgi:chitodextrinase